MDPLQTETARFWQNHAAHNDVDPAAIQIEVIELPIRKKVTVALSKLKFLVDLLCRG